jgi:small ligand-binding sensory domain FIST
VAGHVLEALGRHPDLCVLFVTPAHAGALEDAAGAVTDLLAPSVLFGAAAVSVVGRNQEVEEGPGVSLWAGRFGPVLPLRLEADDGMVTGWPEPLAFEPRAALLVADPFTFPAEALYDELTARHPGLAVIGGNASAANHPGANRLVLGTQVLTTGAVGALLGPGPDISTVVSQGCRPIGRPFVVTRAEGHIIYELAGEPPLHRLVRMANSELPEQDIELLNRGLHVGVVIDERKTEFERGDFLVRNVLGADRENGAMAVGQEVDVGTTVQFHVRDAATADEDLRGLLAGRHAEGALLFTCNGRGVRLFGRPDHDAAVVEEHLNTPLAGFFAAGEFGPVGGRNFVHGFTASLALFHDRT